LSTTIEIPSDILRQIHSHGESAYPEEGAGLLLGEADGDHKRVSVVMGLDNAREQAARHNRYLITPQDMLRGEQEASRLGLDVLGVFHSHPDHPNRPSDYDREWAMPWYSYVITSVQGGQAVESRSWRLEEDRSAFSEEQIHVTGEFSPAIRK
jgi:proteasome lid subunit RPN8/RPN11